MNKLNYIDIFEKDFPYFIADTVFSDALTTKAHTHNFNEFFLVKQGEVYHYHNNEVSLLHEGEIVLIKPEDIHYFKAKSTSLAVITNVAFTKQENTIALDFLQSSTKEKYPIVERKILLNINECNLMITRFDQIYKLSHATDKFTLLIQFRALLIEVLIKFLIKPKMASLENPLWLSKACIEMEKDENYKIGLTRFIELSGKTQEHLTRSLKKNYGVTPSEFINSIRISQAAKQLRNTALPINEIMYSLGFENPSYFNRIFKKKYGHAPNKYRQVNFSIINPNLKNENPE